jgi:hypothetical protein
MEELRSACGKWEDVSFFSPANCSPHNAADERRPYLATHETTFNRRKPGENVVIQWPTCDERTRKAPRMFCGMHRRAKVPLPCIIVGCSHEHGLIPTARVQDRPTNRQLHTFLLNDFPAYTSPLPLVVLICVCKLFPSKTRLPAFKAN